ADAILPPEHLGGADRSRANDIERGHAGIVQVPEGQRARLAARAAGVVPAHVGSGRIFHSGFEDPLHQVRRALPRAFVRGSLLGFHRRRHHDALLQTAAETAAPEGPIAIWMLAVEIAWTATFSFCR